MSAQQVDPAVVAHQALADQDIKSLVAAVAETTRIPSAASPARLAVARGQRPEHTRERPTALCACVEPHVWGGACEGPAPDARTAIQSLALRLISAKEDPITGNDDYGPDPMVELTQYGITEPEVDFLVALLGALARGDG